MVKFQADCYINFPAQCIQMMAFWKLNGFLITYLTTLVLANDESDSWTARQILKNQAVMSNTLNFWQFCLNYSVSSHFAMAVIQTLANGARSLKSK